MNENCIEYPLNFDNIDKQKLTNDMDVFCSALKSNKLKEYQDAFLNLPSYVQCLFAYYCNIIFKRFNSGDESITDRNIQIAVRLYNLFIKEKIRLNEEVIKIVNKFKVDRIMALKAKEKLTAPIKKEKAIYEKEYQKKPSLDNKDPLFRFYNSLYDEKPNCRLAIVWLIEHGAFEGLKRDDLITRYKKLKFTK